MCQITVQAWLDVLGGTGGLMAVVGPELSVPSAVVLRFKVNWGTSLNFAFNNAAVRKGLTGLYQSEWARSCCCNKQSDELVVQTLKVRSSRIPLVWCKLVHANWWVHAPLLVEVTQGPSWRSGRHFLTLPSRYMFPRFTQQRRRTAETKHHQVNAWARSNATTFAHI